MTHTADLALPQVAIIGAGPVGLFSVFTCGMMRLRCALFDTLPQAGGQCQELYPEKPIYDIPAFAQVTGASLTKNLLDQIKPFYPVWNLQTRITHLDKTPQGWVLNKRLDTPYQAVIIAGGAGSFEPLRPPLNDLDSFEGKSVFYAVTQKEQFRGKNIVIAGGGDSAIDWALTLAPLARSLTFVHRRATFRASPENTALLKQAVHKGRISLLTPYQLKGLEGETTSGSLSAVIVSSLKGEIKKINADVLLPFFGLKSTLGPLENWMLDMQNQKIIINPTTAETNQPGLYAVGDIATYPYKRKLILTGFAEAAQAAASIQRSLCPEAPVSLGHSTSSGIPSLPTTQLPEAL